MADGVLGDDDETFRGPLPPEDRLWRHPSEMAGDRPSPDRAPWGTALVSAAGGAFVVGALWLAVGGGTTGGGQLVTQWVSLVPVESVAPLVIPADEWTDEVTRIARPGIATVQAMDGETIAAAVAVRDDGTYITSGRALGDADTVTLVTSTGTAVEAKVVGYDPATDVSVLRVDGATTPAVVALTPRLAVGDVLALAHPSGEGAEYVVTSKATTMLTINGDWLVGVVALDGTLGDTPPGSPAVDRTGAVVGVTVATASGAPAALVPIDVASDVAAELLESGMAEHPRLGITTLDARRAHSGDVQPTVAGATVMSVEPGGPAEAGGILEGDVVIEFGGVEVDSMAAMVAEIRTHQPGDVVDVTVMRVDQRVNCRVELGAPTPDAATR